MPFTMFKMKASLPVVCLLVATSSLAMTVQDTANLFKDSSTGTDLPLTLISVVAEKLQGSEQLKTWVNSLGIQQDFVKPLEKMLKLVSKLDFKKQFTLSSGKQDKKIAELVEQLLRLANSTMKSVPSSGSIKEPIQQIMSLSSLLSELYTADKASPINSNDDDSKSITAHTQLNEEHVTIENITSSASDVWMVIKSTWQKILSHVEEENSLTTFMRFTPFRVIDRIVSLGDNVNLMGFLAQKLEPSLAEFITKNVSPYLGPLRDFESFYNFAKENGVNGLLDYFGSKKFKHTFDTMVKVVSAYLEDAVTDDIVDSYIDFISFNNKELHNFYKSVMHSMNKNADGANASSIEGNATRVKRDIFQDIASIYKFNDNSESMAQPYEYSQQSTNHNTAANDFAQRSGTYDNVNPNYSSESGSYAVAAYNYSQGGTSYGAENSNHTDEAYENPSSRQLQRFGLLGGSSYLYDPSRDGYGGGGGGYGGGQMYGMNMNTMDPYLVLGSLILGALLGFLLFRALRSTGGGRRDINDGSLTLWQSDKPSGLIPWSSKPADRMKRSKSEKKDEFNLSASLRGDIWSTDPLVGEEFLADLLEEDDIADHLNSLWNVYQESNETACVQSYFCDFMANSTAERLTGKDASVSLLMASLSNMIGVSGQGQLIDDVTQKLVLGNSYTCTNPSGCHFSY